MPDLKRLIQKTKRAEEDIKKKDIVLFIGETGSGKTTTIKGLLGYKMGIKLYKGMKWLTIVEDIKDEKVKAMHSNPECKSVTRYVVAVRPKPEITKAEIYFTDSAGFNDTEGIEVQVSNLVGMKKALKGCNSVRIVIVISSENWGERGKGLKRLGQTLAALFNNFDDIKGSLLTIFNRFSDLNELRSKIENLISNLRADEKADDNFFGFLRYLNEQDTLKSYEPLTGVASNFVRDEIMKIYPLKNPKSIFSNSSITEDQISKFCAHMEKRIKYHASEKNT